MSKLMKFARGLDAEDAAKLLSGLINEEVDSVDIWVLFHEGHLGGYVDLDATIVKTEPMLELEEHHRMAQQGRYIMTACEDIEMCWGAHLPCLTIQVDRTQSATGLFDRKGNIYALRSNGTGEYLDLENDEAIISKQLFEPADLLKLAEKANGTDPAIPAIDPKTNKWCAMGGEYFNFPHNNDHALAKPANKPITVEPPSRNLALAAVLEVALSDRKKHTQSSLIAAIETKYKGIRGLGESALQKLFAEANASLSKARPE